MKLDNEHFTPIGTESQEPETRIHEFTGSYKSGETTVLHFGHGMIDVFKARQRYEYQDELAFVLRPHPTEIGTVNTDLSGIRTSALECPVRFVFDSVDSIDVIIQQLIELRLEMVKGGETTQ